jgi:hypothetical protein
MGAFLYRLEQEDGTPADPPTLTTAVPDWRPGDTIPLGRERICESLTPGSSRARMVNRCQC